MRFFSFGVGRGFERAGGGKSSFFSVYTLSQDGDSVDLGWGVLSCVVMGVMKIIGYCVMISLGVVWKQRNPSCDSNLVIET
jgi:hypothetical protein